MIELKVSALCDGLSWFVIVLRCKLLISIVSCECIVGNYPSGSLIMEQKIIHRGHPKVINLY